MEDMTSLCQLKEYMPTCGFNNRKQKRKQSQGATRTVKKNAKMKMEQQTQRNRTVKLFERTNGSFDFTASLFCEGWGSKNCHRRWLAPSIRNNERGLGRVNNRSMRENKQISIVIGEGGVGP